jgi:hypothetical protein
LDNTHARLRSTQLQRWGARYVALALVSVTACSAPAERTDSDGVASADVCVPGEQVDCECNDGTRGVTTCNETGQTLDACMCAGRVDRTDVSGVLVAQGGAAGDPALQRPRGADSVESPLATDIRVTQLAMYQAVKIPLMQDGEEVIARNAPIVVGKQALLRVYVEPLAGFVPRQLIAELTLVSSSEIVQPIAVRAQIAAASSEAALDSTLNVALPAAYVTGDLRYAVSLHEVEAAGAPVGKVDAGVRWPQDGGALAALGAREAGPLHVMYVPYRYLADGSGRLPQVDDAELTNYRDHMHALYPASEIVIDVHEPVDYEGEVSPQSGWNEWLDFHCALRAQEAPDPRVLYYGAIAPADSWESYGSGVVGISNVPGPAGNYGRCSVGIGFPGSANTAAHELGHALGLPHAPCGIEGSPFPYPDAEIGSWGYGLVSNTLKDPAQYYDMMSYCQPAFISDFNYERLFERIRYLNQQYDRTPEDRARYVRVLVAADGSATHRGTVEFAGVPGGDEDLRPMMARAAQGDDLSPIDAFFFPFSNDGSGEWLIPDTGASSVQIDGVGEIELQ